MRTSTVDGIARIMLLCLLLMSFTKVVPYLPVIPDPVYYGVFVASLLWMVFRGGFILSYTWLPFLVAIFLSIVVNDIPAYFQVGFRVIAFLSVTLTIGPFLVNPIITMWRRLLFIHSLTFIRCIVIFSFLAWIIKKDLVYGKSGFEGFASQSMLLGLLAGISLLYSLYRFYLFPRLSTRYKESGIMVVSLLILILAGSRSALGSTMVAVAFFYSRIYRHHVMRLGKVVFTILCLAVLTSGFWWSHTERLREKMENGEKSGSLTSSRDALWEDRMNEFKAFPVFGVGFASIVEGQRDQVTGTIEPGSSWLFILSSMGIVGFLSFAIPVFKIVYRLFTKESGGINGYLLGALLFLCLFHMIFEGYVIASGAYSCFFLWLLLSECNRVVKLNN
ncbi:hypothetical protein DXD68_16670 [Parabacteroides sp. TM07-1AC]|uniref:O-antigen ligase family protein n=1 Tax=Parabacteroides sp. TM07-1AC TaxID=2292363 RepID=UPI000EFDFF4C|nr:O-antigen ligase family protein [Parabacteroides sp. TM07-1AC]RHU24748.1 hypothetical protein DXD68_16670 [Parabacteroides sp. TM07-1AC]